MKLESEREITYNPERLSGVSVYKAAERQFAEGDRIQFRAPMPEQKVANSEIGTLEKIEGERFTVKLDDERRVEFDTKEFRHLDYGYAVTSYSSQGQTVDRVIVNADTRESDLLLNQRMGYVALSRAREDARVYTNSTAELGAALDRQVDKQMALEAVKESQANSNKITSPHNTQGNENGTERAKKKGIKWLHVTAQDPCPVCHKPDNCAVSADGALAYCRRVESDRPGRDDGFVHVLSDRPDYTPRLVAPEDQVPQHDRADIEHRDNVYQDLLATLDLKERERKNLAARGLDSATIDENNYKSVPSKVMADAIAQALDESSTDLRGVPGFYREEREDGQPGAWRLNVGTWHQGLMVPVRDAEGRIGRIEGFQIRRAEVKDDSPRYVWLSSSNKLEGTSSGAPAHFRNVEQIRTTGRAIITEGALKGDIIASYLDRGVIAVQGVSSFKEDFGAKLREQIPELRKASIAFDADYAHNPNVQRALTRLTGTMQRAGLEVETLKWEESQGKGLDDYLQVKLGQNFSQVPQLERAERQQQVLRELGWGEMRPREQQAAHKVESPQVARQDEDNPAKRAYEAKLQETERRIVLGDEESAAMNVTHQAWRHTQAQEQSAGRRYKVVDQSTGLTREMSLHDLEQRAIACSTRLTEEQSPATATERMELRRKQYADELNSHEQTLKALASAHNNAMRCFQNDLNQARRRASQDRSTSAGGRDGIPRRRTRKVVADHSP